MTTRVVKSVSLPSVSVRESLAPGRGRERCARDESSPRIRCVVERGRAACPHCEGVGLDVRC